MISRAGLYSGGLMGRLGGGYLGYKGSSLIIENPETVQIPPSLDFGTYGPEEAIAYTGIGIGYIVGSILTAKGVTKVQDYLGLDFEERRPLNMPAEKVKEYLSEEKSDLEEGMEFLFEDEEE